MTPQEAFALAQQHHRAGRLSEARGIYQQIIVRQPDHADSLHMLGMLARDAGQYEAALNWTYRALAAKPDLADAHYTLGLILKKMGRLDHAIEAYQNAIRLQSNYAEVFNSLGIARRETGKLPDAIKAYRDALSIKPKFPEAWYNLGIALRAIGNDTEAAGAFRQAIALRPNYGEAYNELGLTLLDQSKLLEAAAQFRQAIQFSPRDPRPQGNLAGVLFQLRQHPEGLVHYQRAVELAPASASDGSNLLLALNYPDGIDPKAIFAEHLRWADQHAKSADATGFQASTVPAPMHEGQDPATARRIRVGYLSPDFRRHSVSHFIEPILAAHDRTRFETFVYSDVSRPDAVTARLRQHVDLWKDISRLGDDQVVESIRADRLDILVDLAGHTGGNRLPIFTRRLAPVQVSYLGYPNTTGLPRQLMQYRLTDEIADPPGLSEAIHTEFLARLPGSFLCYRPALDAPAVAPPPSAQNNDVVTFGSFTSMTKLTAAMLQTWSQILHRLPTARLLIKNNSLADAQAAESLRKDFERLGVFADRLILTSAVASHDQHLARYAEMDIALDTYPYNGTTTICDALWMGIPVITLAGDVHRSRVGASLLNAVGLQELIARTRQQYIDLAVALAENQERRAILRTELRDRMRQSPLMDEAGFTRRLEEKYRWMLSQLDARSSSNDTASVP